MLTYHAGPQRAYQPVIKTLLRKVNAPQADNQLSKWKEKEKVEAEYVAELFLYMHIRKQLELEKWSTPEAVWETNFFLKMESRPREAKARSQRERS